MTTAGASIEKEERRNFVERYADTAEEQDAVRDSVRRGLDALLSFLDGVYARSLDAEGAE